MTTFQAAVKAQRLAEVDQQLHSLRVQIEIDEADMAEWENTVVEIAVRYGLGDERVAKMERNIAAVRRHKIELVQRQRQAMALHQALTRGEEG